MSLSATWVDSIFDRLTLVYGQDFLRRWEGLEIIGVKADWARELAAYSQHPEALVYALDHLPPERPPTVLQFRDLCQRRPSAAPALPPPASTDPAAARRVAEQLQHLKGGAKDPKAWAYALRDSEQRGDPMTQAQRSAWREALQRDDQPRAA